MNEIRLAVENAKSQFDPIFQNDNLSILNNNLINNKDEIIELIDKRIDEHLEKLKKTMKNKNNFFDFQMIKLSCPHCFKIGLVPEFFTMLVDGQ